MTELEPLLTVEKWLRATDSERMAAVSGAIRRLGTEFCLADTMSGRNDHLASLFHTPSSTEWILIPGGVYQRGLSLNEEGAARRIQDPPPLSIEEMRPVERVEVPSLAVMKYPVSEDLATSVLGDLEERFRPEFDGPKKSRVVYLSEAEVIHIADKLNCRLPTEEQWEYLCRAGTTSLFWFGDSLPETHEELQSLFSVDFSKNTKSNPFGLKGMFVGHWCQDRFRQNYQLKAGTGAPRVIRGGASAFWPWQDSGEWAYAASAARMPATDLLGDVCGARFVRLLEE